MPLRIIKQVSVLDPVFLVKEIHALSQHFDHEVLRCAILRHFDSDRRAVSKINRTIDANFNRSRGLYLPMELAQEFGILSGDWLEIDCTHRVKSEGRQLSIPIELFPLRDLLELDFDPDGYQSDPTAAH